MARNSFPVRRNLEQIWAQEGLHLPMTSWGEKKEGAGGREEGKGWERGGEEVQRVRERKRNRSNKPGVLARVSCTVKSKVLAK